MILPPPADNTFGVLQTYDVKLRIIFTLARCEANLATRKQSRPLARICYAETKDEYPQTKDKPIPMNRTIGLLSSLLQDEDGQDLIEYALVPSLIGLGVLVAMSSLSMNTGMAFNNLESQFTHAI